MKKILTILLTCFLLSVSLFVLTACGGGKENNNDGNEILNIYNTYVAYAESNGNTPLSYEEWLKSIKGDKGDKGEKGDKGDAGQDGKDGQNGKDGVGIEDIVLDENGNLLITFTDGTTKTLTLPEIGAGNNDEENTEQGTPGLQYQRITGKKEYSVVGLGIASELDIIIPSTYNGLSVTSIGERAFLGCESLESIEIPDSVTSIGDYAFGYCESLTSIEIPASVTSIGDGAFGYCSSLETIKVDGNNTKYKSIDGNLYSKDGKTLIQYAIGKTAVSFLIPDSVTSIGDYAFYTCYSLTRIEIPDSVASIGSSAFENCDSLTSIKIPASVTSIGSSAFSSCYTLTSIIYDGTKAQWQELHVGFYGDVEIECIDGTIYYDPFNPFY